MKLAQRITSVEPSPTLAITAKAKAMKTQGLDVVGLGAGEPDFDTPDFVKKAAIKALNQGFTKYTPVSGTDELREAVCAKLKKDNGLEYTPSNIVISCGAKHSIYNVINCVCSQGDEVLIPSPYWVSYPEQVRLAQAQPAILPTTEKMSFKITPDSLASALTDKTRIVILNTPSNPTGAAYTQKELEALIPVLKDRDILIISDEIYEKITYDGLTHVSIASLDPEIKDKTVVVNGLSKSHSMTGWRIGYIAAPKAVATAVSTLQSHSTSNPTSFAQSGAVAALNGSDESVQAMTREFIKRRDYCLKRIDAIPGLSCIKPQGAFYLFMNITGTGLDSSAFSEKLLKKEQVALVPGIAFGDNGHVRISYATSMKNLIKAFDRIASFCNSL